MAKPIQYCKAKWSKKKKKQLKIKINKVKKKKRHSLQDSWDNRNHASLRVIGIPEGKERERGIENICEEIMV